MKFKILVTAAMMLGSLVCSGATGADGNYLDRMATECNEISTSINNQFSIVKTALDDNKCITAEVVTTICSNATALLLMCGKIEKVAESLSAVNEWHNMGDFVEICGMLTKSTWKRRVNELELCVNRMSSPIPLEIANAVPTQTEQCWLTDPQIVSPLIYGAICIDEDKVASVSSLIFAACIQIKTYVRACSQLIANGKLTVSDFNRAYQAATEQNAAGKRNLSQLSDELDDSPAKIRRFK